MWNFMQDGRAKLCIIWMRRVEIADLVMYMYGAIYKQRVVALSFIILTCSSKKKNHFAFWNCDIYPLFCIFCKVTLPYKYILKLYIYICSAFFSAWNFLNLWNFDVNCKFSFSDYQVVNCIWDVYYWNEGECTFFDEFYLLKILDFNEDNEI